MANTKVTSSLIANGAVTGSHLSGVTTAHIGEGSNLYHTTARARGSISVTGSDISYDSSTGVIQGARPSLAQVLGQGNSTGSAGIAFPDNQKAFFGGSLDLQIYHDGNHARVNNGTGNFNLQSDDFHLTDSSNTTLRFRVDADGATDIRYNGSTKLVTTASGISVTGVINSTGGITASHINTGQGATEVHMMNQNLRTTDDVTFDDLTVTGNLNITGDINSYNVTDLDVTDKTITLGKGQTAANSANSGITIDGANAQLFWSQGNSRWQTNKSFLAVGLITAYQTDNNQIMVESAGDYFPSYRIRRTGGSSKTNYTWEFQIGSTGFLNFKDITNGYYPIILNASGDVLLGSDTSGANPTVKIDQAGTNLQVRDGGELRAYRGGNSAYAALLMDTGETLYIKNSWANKYIVLNRDGEVGIGTNNPVQKLDVRGGNIMVGGFNGGSDYGMLFTPADASSYWHIYNDAGGELVFGKNITIGSSEHMRLDGSGRLGIGTNNPQQKLEIVTGGFAYLRTRSTASGFTGFDIGQHSSGAIYLNNRDNTSIIFQTNNSPRMYLNNSGFLGLGASPGVELDVRRTTNAYPLRIGSSQGEGRAIVFADIHATPNKYNWITGSQYNVNDSFEITPSSAVGGYTFNDPSMVFKPDGQVLVNLTGSDVGASTNIMELNGSIRLQGGNHSIKLNNGTIEVHAARVHGSNMFMLNDRIQLDTTNNLTFIPVVNNAYNFKVFAGDGDSWFGVYDDANNSVNVIMTRSDTVESFKHVGHTGETIINAVNTGLQVNSTNNSAIKITGNGGGLNFTTGANQRIYFGGQRALEGNSTSNILQFGEGFTSALYQTSGNVFYGNVTPSTTNSFDLGSSSHVWRDLYIGDLNLNNENRINDDGSTGNEIDGTTGNWTIQEGEEHLYIINNKNGKKYKFALEEIE